VSPKVVGTGLLGGIVAILWTAIVGSLLPLRDRMGNMEVPNEEAVLAALDENLTETGVYLVPGKFPHDSLFLARFDEGPIFRVHSLPEGGGGLAQFLVSDLALLLGPIIPAWFLMMLCGMGRPGYGSRVFVVALFGVFLALAAYLPLWDQELYPPSYVFLLAANAVVTWVVVGLVLAWRIKPRPLDRGV
jgi:hypothetical protein